MLFCSLQPFIVNYILLYCQVWTETCFFFFRKYVFTLYFFSGITCYPGITWQLANDIF